MYFSHLKLNYKYLYSMLYLHSALLHSRYDLYYLSLSPFDVCVYI